ncbi:TAXI family TRAP transporter solute-binding subunit [Hoeflea sp. YIM 152468]|uniref:TAXI family TRAP transporter solute-binding subunit n=1 Tax=Hoeflea sp. YIM 152468 TaxID=3031759 RepID=UPI0023D9A5D3|nr:TAXI family TRAP transporter solute-binding subunit [Hoeflea sp. YIM 152468]MDF1610397.1 TAXI family TRAP transporter solute-binding subunit [Hoeflea sp. YIM 152468]
MGLRLSTLLCAARVLASAVALVAGAGSAQAQDIRYFTIGTAGVGGTYFPLAGTIANAISNPPGSRQCDEGGSCGVPGLVAVAQSSHGSVANVSAIISGGLNTGFSQSDVAYWAYSGTGIFEGQEPMRDLRVIAALYPEHIHLIAAKASGISSVADLKGKRVSLDKTDSGTYPDARLVLEAFGLSDADITIENLMPEDAADALRQGRIDALFFVGGYPARAIAELASSAAIVLVPIQGPDVDGMVLQHSFFTRDAIPDGVYDGVPGVPTIAVGAQWLTRLEQDEDLIYQVTRALWNPATRKLLDVGHAKGAVVTLQSALNGIAIPLHPGAEKYYREAGMIR